MLVQKDRRSKLDEHDQQKRQDYMHDSGPAGIQECFREEAHSATMKVADGQQAKDQSLCQIQGLAELIVQGDILVLGVRKRRCDASVLHIHQDCSGRLSEKSDSTFSAVRRACTAASDNQVTALSYIELDEHYHHSTVLRG